VRTAILLLALVLAACADPAAAARPRQPAPPVPAAIAPHAAELRLDLVELGCRTCAGRIAAGTARVPGVLHVSAATLEHTLAVTYDPTTLTATALIAAIDKVVDSVAQ
jgi:hypothetical protein